MARKPLSESSDFELIVVLLISVLAIVVGVGSFFIGEKALFKPFFLSGLIFLVGVLFEMYRRRKPK